VNADIGNVNCQVIGDGALHVYVPRHHVGLHQLRIDALGATRRWRWPRRDYGYVVR
jgi:hypothetical protein